MFILENLPNNPEATKAFTNFAIKAKLIFSADLAAIEQERAQRRADYERNKKERSEKIAACHKQIDELCWLLTNNPKLKTEDIPSHLKNALERCLYSQHIKRSWFTRYLRIEKNGYPRTEWDYGHHEIPNY